MGFDKMRCLSLVFSIPFDVFIFSFWFIWLVWTIFNRNVNWSSPGYCFSSLFTVSRPNSCLFPGFVTYITSAAERRGGGCGRKQSGQHGCLFLKEEQNQMCFCQHQRRWRMNAYHENTWHLQGASTSRPLTGGNIDLCCCEHWWKRFCLESLLNDCWMVWSEEMLLRCLVFALIKTKSLN